MSASYKRFTGLVLTNLSFQASVGLFGVNSIAKKPMAILFNYDESFLGVIDGTEILGQLVGCLITLFITINPAKGYLLYGILNGIFGILLYVPRYIPNFFLRDAILLVSFFCQCLFAASVTFTQIILNHDQSQQSTKAEQSIWFSLVYLGDLCSVVFAQYLITEWGFQWQGVKLIWNGYIIFIGVLLYLYYRQNIVEESEIKEIMQGHNPNDDIANALEYKSEGKPIKKIEDFSKLQIFLILCKKMFQFLKQPQTLLIVLSFALIQGLNGSQLYWVPYYYIQNNQEAYSTLASSLISLSLIIGGLFSELILYGYFNLEKYSKKISYILLLLSAITYFALWVKRYDDPKTQIILLSLANILISSVLCRASTVDVIQESRGNSLKAKIIFLMSHLLRSGVILIFVVICGYLMQIDLHYFWHVVLVTILLALFVGSLRIYLYMKTSAIDQASKDNKGVKQQE